MVVVEGGDDIGADPAFGQSGADARGEPDRREARMRRPS